VRARTASEHPPVRIVHLGVGAFHRAHQAWYTHHASDASQWGIAGFTGRSLHMASLLAPQDGLYTLTTRDGDTDTTEVITSLTEIHDGSDLVALTRLLTTPAVAIVTLTITEGAYGEGTEPVSTTSAPSTAIGRLAHALYARWRRNAEPIAVVPCDNLPSNGIVVRDLMRQAAEGSPEGFTRWLETEVSFVSTSVDRITPGTPDGLTEHVLTSTGEHDDVPVVTEPYTSWVLDGRFPAGRPRWEDAGAVFTDDIQQYERRKLWMLNGAHTILAVLGPDRGHLYVDEAISDPALLHIVEQFWVACVRHVDASLNPNAYRSELLRRFHNTGIRHELTQIARDTETKLRVRLAPVAEAERAAGRSADAVSITFASWAAARQLSPVEAVRALSPILAADAGFLTAVKHHHARLGQGDAARPRY